MKKMTRINQKKKGKARTTPHDDLDPFDIDWDMIRNESQASSNVSTALDCSLTNIFVREDDIRLEEKSEYDFSDNNKFNFLSK